MISKDILLLEEQAEFNNSARTEANRMVKNVTKKQALDAIVDYIAEAGRSWNYIDHVVYADISKNENAASDIRIYVRVYFEGNV